VTYGMTYLFGGRRDNAAHLGDPDGVAMAEPDAVDGGFRGPGVRTVRTAFTCAFHRRTHAAV